MGTKAIQDSSTKQSKLGIFMIFLLGFQGFEAHAFQTSFPLVASDSMVWPLKSDVLVLGKYRSDKRKQVKRGTVIRVFPSPLSRDTSYLSSDLSFLSGRASYRGKFESIQGDVITMIRKGKVMKFGIDELYRIKVYHPLEARVFGNVMNAAGIGAIGIGTLFMGVTAKMALERSEWTGLFVPLAGIYLGAGLLLHRLALAINRRKYNLRKWYIQRTEVVIE